MKLNKILIIGLLIFIGLILVNTVNAADFDGGVGDSGGYSGGDSDVANPTPTVYTESTEYGMNNVFLDDGPIKQIKVSNDELMEISEGKKVKKTVKIKGKVKKYGKTKKLTFKSSYSKKKIKKMIKKVSKGKGSLSCQFWLNAKQTKLLKNAKIKSIKFIKKYKYFDSPIGKFKDKYYQAIVKYKPFKKTVKKTKNTKVYLYGDGQTMNQYGFIEVKYYNPFSKKTIYTFGDI